MMNPSAKSFTISSPIILCFSSSKRHRHYFTGLELGLIFKACLVTSLKTPSMSKGLHAKISLLARRKSASVLSYFEESMVPMHATLPSKPLGSMRTSMVPSIGLRDPSDRLGLGASSTTSSLMAASSLEVTIAAACLQHSTSHSYAR